MNWNLIKYDLHSGSYNMEFDLDLVKNCDPEIATLRFYGWQPSCISLGANQSFDDINIELSNQDNIDVVKRPTGGRAILHSNELTYSVILPHNNVSGRELYEKISKAIVIGLRTYSPKLLNVNLENEQPNFPSLLKQSEGSICFASTAKSEIKFENKKLVGSAQRKIGDVILQHGSILIGSEHEKLVKYLNISEKEKNVFSQNFSKKTDYLENILDDKINITLLQENIIKGFEEIFAAKFNTELIPSLEL